MSLLISAFLLGLTGSFHCAGMCGPIAVSLPLYGNSLGRKVLCGGLYNIGRILTYGIMGLFFGLIGQGFHLIGFQQVISVIMGTIMIISALFPSVFRVPEKQSGVVFQLLNKLKITIRKLFSVSSWQSLFFIGLLNGLLPCGLVYMAMAGAIVSGNVLSGIGYMIFFGLGTIPVLLLISVSGNVISSAVRNKVNKLIPVLVVVVGLFFILRGLNLGIPYLSPTKEKIEKKFEKSQQVNSGTSTFLSRSF